MIEEASSCSAKLDLLTSRYALGRGPAPTLPIEHDVAAAPSANGVHMPAIVVNGQADSDMSVHKAGRSKEPVKPFHLHCLRANCGILMATAAFRDPPRLLHTLAESFSICSHGRVSTKRLQTTGDLMRHGIPMGRIDVGGSELR